LGFIVSACEPRQKDLLPLSREETCTLTVGRLSVRLLFLEKAGNTASYESLKPKIFELPLRVLPEDIDGQNHVNNTVYLRWVQDVAVAHWQALASAQAQSEISWVVVRHEIDYKAPGCLGDEVILRTWVGEATRLRFERLTEILRRLDQRLLATARTLWVPINPATGKPTRVSTELREQFSV
jgi:acyl-CoA thioester hydrolase